MIELLADFMDAIPDARSPEAARALLRPLAERLGFEWVMLARMREEEGTGLAFPDLVDTDLPLMDDYLSSGLYRRDPMLPRMMAARTPIIMPLAANPWGPMTPAEADVFEGGPRRASTVRVLIPTQVGSGARWAFGFSAADPLPEAEASRRASMLWLAAAAAGDSLRAAARGAPEDPAPLIEPAEREAILRLAAGLAAPPDAPLAMPDGEASALILRAGRRFGARTGPEAVGVAIARRLVSP